MRVKSIISSIKKHTFFKKLSYKFGKFAYLKNKVLINKADQDKCLRKYRVKYKNVIKNFDYSSLDTPKKSNIIWVFWYQGIENAPLIVQKCVNSQKKYAVGYEVRVIDKNNLIEYLELPEYINKKFEDGIITFTHYSDIVRISLLAKYGGIWMDSTVLLTYITDNPLFVFKNIDLDRCDETQTVASSWLISSYTNQKIILLVRDLLYEYWKHKNKLDDYFLFHIFFKMATDCFTNDWNNVPTYSNINPHILYFECLNEYNAKRFQDILKISSVHKLNRRTEKVNKLYTFYDYIIDNDL